MTFGDDQRKERIKAIAIQIVTSQVAKGEVAETEEAIEAAMREAVQTAKAAYDAAQEFLT